MEYKNDDKDKHEEEYSSPSMGESIDPLEEHPNIEEIQNDSTRKKLKLSRIKPFPAPEYRESVLERNMSKERFIKLMESEKFRDSLSDTMKKRISYLKKTQ